MDNTCETFVVSIQLEEKREKEKKGSKLLAYTFFLSFFLFECVCVCCVELSEGKKVEESGADIIALLAVIDENPPFARFAFGSSFLRLSFFAFNLLHLKYRPFSFRSQVFSAGNK